MPKKKPAVSPLDAHLGYWLRCLSNQVSHAFQRKVEDRGVTVAEWVVLRAMYDRAPLNPSQLAEELGMTRGAISKLIERLVGKGLVACQADPDDRRYQSVHLLPAGQRLTPQLAALADANDAEFFGHLTDDARRELLAVLKDLVRRHGEITPPVD